MNTAEHCLVEIKKKNRPSLYVKSDALAFIVSLMVFDDVKFNKQGKAGIFFASTLVHIVLWLRYRNGT